MEVQLTIKPLIQFLCYFKVFHQEKKLNNQAFESLTKISNVKVENLLANANKTLELEHNFLAKQDKTSILFHQEMSLFQNIQHCQGLWAFQNFGNKKVQNKETLEFLNRSRANLMCSWTAAEKQRRKLILFLERIHRMKVSFALIEIHLPVSYIYIIILSWLSQVYLLSVDGKSTGLELIFVLCFQTEKLENIFQTNIKQE